MGLQTAVAPAFCPVPTLGPKQRRRKWVGDIIYCFKVTVYKLSPPAGEADTMGRGGSMGEGEGGAAVSHQAMAWEGALL